MVQETFAATSTVEDILSTEDKLVVLKGWRQVAIPGAHSDICSSCFLLSKVFVVHKFWSFPSMLLMLLATISPSFRIYHVFYPTSTYFRMGWLNPCP
jgi:hypothetical protein